MRWKDGRRSDNIEDRRGENEGMFYDERLRLVGLEPELKPKLEAKPKTKKLSTLVQAAPGMASDNERLRSMTKEYAKGGKVGGRGDGCCAKGKTKGRVV